jgi:hypothetical protein
MPLPSLFSPLGLLLWLGWNVLVLASIQLTVRLILAFSVRTTLIGALAYTVGSLPIAALYRYVLDRSLGWYPLAMALSGLLGYAVARWALRIRRQRGRVVAACGTAILSGPWPLFMDLLPR